MTQIDNWKNGYDNGDGTRKYSNSYTEKEIESIVTLAKAEGAAEEKKRIVEIIKEYCLEQGVETYFLPELLKKID